MASDTRIIYLTPPAPVSMTDFWYEIADLNHFWVRRRFDVMQRLAGPIVREAVHIAEIGCGNGLVQRQIEDTYGLSVAGFELNQLALKQNCSRSSPLYCYNIHQCSPELTGKFDLFLAFDVLEHIDDESGFLHSILHHMTPSGRLLLNVPAHQFFYSRYDHAAGHVRRYSRNYLTKVAAKNGLRIASSTYWGFPLIPLLLMRKAVVSLRRDEKSIISSGFDPGSPVINRLLRSVSRCEVIPQNVVGTSLMAVLERASG